MQSGYLSIHLEWVGPIARVEEAVPGVVADREAWSEVGPEDRFIITGVNVSEASSSSHQYTAGLPTCPRARYR